MNRALKQLIEMIKRLTSEKDFEPMYGIPSRSSRNSRVTQVQMPKYFKSRRFRISGKLGFSIPTVCITSHDLMNQLVL